MARIAAGIAILVAVTPGCGRLEPPELDSPSAAVRAAATPTSRTAGPITAAPLAPVAERTESTDRARSDAETGVEGAITYHPDPHRPWRQARYYVHPASGGPLAEALVALRGPGLVADRRQLAPTIHTIDQRNFMFIPETTALVAGDSVRFTNTDPEIHNVSTFDGEAPFNISLTTGAEHVQTFRRAGGIRAPVHLGCAFHGSMRAWVYVFDHPYFCVTTKDGSFRFEGVPPGEYWLDVVHPAGGLEASRQIRVERGNVLSTRIELSPDDATPPG